ncbi:hypoxia-inducible factor 1-alpha inhibitor-like [Sycon ciliatum]|uniref:hypoxia-inducible factor 1-alpha inhibitor-like n=1 Tax=Sycon ciliatum TaxID=27933 RepID=UPI0031F60B3C|eukprot:scpid59082/ scgid4406/ Hypoxia-inducible factor 1-alpha inhibitor; Factor inhibiting HIF-1; Hypoxia-inducible factor asparagine hydroxylase
MVMTPTRPHSCTEMFELFEEKAKLETQIQALRREMVSLQKQIKTGDYKTKKTTDSESCSKKCPTVKEAPPAEEDSGGVLFSTLSDKRKRPASSARFKGKYPFKTTTLASIDANDPKLEKMLNQGRPVLIKNSNLMKPAVDRWDQLFYAQNIGGPKLAVQLSHTRQFLYYGDMDGKEFVWKPPFERNIGVFPDFIDLVEKLEKNKNGSHSYFHSALEEIAQGPQMRLDYENFNWKWIDRLKPDHWGKLSTNLFILGMPNVVTPAHYDGLQNLFAQIHGFKRCILFSPGHFKTMYPYPHGHPNERQTQIDFDHPNLSVFPRFVESEGIEVIIGPGDVLFIPTFWYHHFESEMDSMTVSMNFWFGDNDTALTKPAVPPKPQDKDQKTKREEEEAAAKADDDLPEDMFRLSTLKLPPDTYKLDEIWDLLLVNDVESLIVQSAGHSRVRQFLQDGFNHRYDLIKYTGIETTRKDKENEKMYEEKQNQEPDDDNKDDTKTGGKSTRAGQKHKKKVAKELESDDNLGDDEEFGEEDGEDE